MPALLLPPVAETVSAGNDSNPEDLVIDKENVERIEKLIETELSAFERQTIELYLIGMNYTEIARVLGKDEKSTDNALQRAKAKIKKQMKQTGVTF